jgi:hypothetical protein
MLTHPDTTERPVQHAEKPVQQASRERPRRPWHRLRRTIAEMNYAAQRVVELQAPWASGDHLS